MIKTFFRLGIIVFSLGSFAVPAQTSGGREAENWKVLCNSCKVLTSTGLSGGQQLTYQLSVIKDMHKEIHSNQPMGPPAGDNGASRDAVHFVIMCYFVPFPVFDQEIDLYSIQSYLLSYSKVTFKGFKCILRTKQHNSIQEERDVTSSG